MADDSYDLDYRFGRPARTYLTEREIARLLIVRGRLQDSISADTMPEWQAVLVKRP